jgi:hypothetical protein
MIFSIRTTLVAGIAIAGLAGTAHADMTIYDHRGFTGESRVVTGDIADLEDVDFDNKVSAVIVRSGTWTLFRDDDFEGESITLGPGQYPNLEDLGFPRNKLSSIRAVPNSGAAMPSGDAALSLAALGGCEIGEVLVPQLGEGIEFVCTEVDDAPRFVIEGSAAGRCIDAGDNAPGHRIQLRPCAPDTRPQKLGFAGSPATPAGSFMLFAYADKCLSASAGAAGAPVGLEVCTGGVNQVWTPGRGAGNSSILVGANGLCLTATPTGANAFGATLAACSQAAHQYWSIRSTEPFD